MKAWFKRRFKAPKKPAYYFAHIPKTAGTSFIVLLDRFFPARSILPQQLWREVGDIEAVKAQDYQLFRGHFGGGGAQLLSDRNLQNLTILRHPVELAYSTYQYVKREKNTVVYDLVHNEQLSFEDFLSHPKTAPLVSNRMVRNLSFDFVEDATAQEVFLSPQTVAYLQPLISKSQQPLTDSQRLQRAKNYIDQCFWFGMLERFDDAMRLLSYRLVAPAIGKTQKLNKLKNRPVVSDTARQRVLSLNTEDMRLYEYADNAFSRKYNDMLKAIGGDELMTDYELDHLLDQYYRENHLRFYSHKLQEVVNFTAADALWGQQWHRREWIGDEQSYFRWSGPGEVSSLDFWMQAKDYEIQIAIINALSSDWLDNLRIQVNEQQVKWHSDDQGVVRTLTLHCPKNLIAANGLLRLAFHSQDLVSHAQAFGSDDNRLVGFALKWVKIKP